LNYSGYEQTAWNNKICWFCQMSYTHHQFIFNYYTIFTARRVCIARTMPWKYVCLSHASIGCKWLYISSFLKIFSPSGSTTILVFPYLVMGWMTGTPLTGVPNARGYAKNHNFQPISRFISQLTQDRATVTMEGE